METTAPLLPTQAPSEGLAAVAASYEPVRLAAVVAAVLESFGTTAEAELAGRVIPNHLPLDARAVRALLALFVVRGAVSKELATIQNLVREAAAAQTVPQALSQEVAQLVETLLVPDTGNLREVLEHLMQGGRPPLEARMVLAAIEGNLEETLEQLELDARVQLARLRQDSALGRFLENRGELRGFQEAIDRVLERFVGSSLQSLRGLDQPYHFLELYFPPASPFLHGQIHFFCDGRRSGRSFDGRHATIVLDLSTTQLGDLWICLAVRNRRCSCSFRTTYPEAVAAIEAEAGDLIKALAEAGYPGTQVQVTLWDGNRLRETAGLMARFAGLNVSA